MQKRLFSVLLSVATMFVSSSLYASESVDQRLHCLTEDLRGGPEQRLAYLDALRDASAAFNVSPEVLVAIKRVESSLTLNPGVINHNRDGSTDHGLHQVNFRVWQPVVEELGISLNRNQFHDVYNNTLVAAWILRRKLERFNGDVFAAVGHYHRGGGRDATSNAIRREYMSKFIPHLREIVARCH
ncbi:MAG: lytic transglycosylase domain-containing protein [Halomonas sp.]|nr:lytic transglycosylase domain-containing protein [Halomonas sp.]MDP3534192.1 lytic transglycosylase domain-containing protein [Halomonas sp.]